MAKAIVPSPAITVLLPVYNAGKFLEEAIVSILNQTFKDFEFLIIDDGSTDDSLEIINRYSKRDNRIKVISRPNKGFVATLDEGMSLAKTNLIARMDADDIALPTRLEVQYKYLQEHPDCSVVGCQLQIIDEEGKKKHIDPRPTQDVNLKLFLAYGCALSGPTVVFRKDIIESIGGFQEAALPAEDYDCWVRLVERYPETKIANMPDVLYLYRENSEGISLSNKVAQIKKTIEIGDKYRSSYVKSKVPFLSRSIHEGWFNDITHVDDNEAQEQLRRIYYTIQTWFRNDISRLDKIRAFLLKRKLISYTRINNTNNLPYIYNQPLSHIFPGENHEE